MAVAIPADFDYLKESLTYTETVIRDVFRLKVENWVKFRHTIAVGTETSHLIGTCVSDEAKDAYLSLGKCHYEVVCSLGYSAKAFYDAHIENPFACGKAIKDFYFHGGALLDILSRIVFVINVPNSHSSKDGRGKYLKHLVDRGQLLNGYKTHVTDYVQFLDSSVIQELVNVRNSMAHYWSIPNKDGSMWPRSELKTTKAFAWPYSESDFHNYSDWQPILTIMKEHFTEIERVQNEIFGLLIRDLPKFEKNIGATII
jgi:hypothetical protein